MKLSKITQEEALKFAQDVVQDPKNSLLLPLIFLGSALPYFFQNLAHGSYVDIINRSIFTTLDYALAQRLTVAINPQGERIRSAFGDQVERLIQDLPSLPRWTIKNVTLPLFGLNPDSLFSNEALAKTALSAASVAIALFTASILTGSGALPLFWAYQQMRVVRGAAMSAIKIYLLPEDYPLTWGAVKWIARELNKG